MSDETSVVRKKYDRIAKSYNVMEFLVERWLFSKFRKKMLYGLRGNILEVGVGTGKNLLFYNKSATVTAVDISPKMMEKARVLVKGNKNVQFHLMDAQRLKFRENTFDFVVATFVLCSVPDPVRALQEMKRVVKPRGRIITLDHVLSKYWIIALWENIHNPITRRLFGFNVNRDTKKNIRTAGLIILKDEKLAFFDVFRKFTCTKTK